MTQQFLKVALAGLFALSTTANAQQYPGFYFGVQGGSADTDIANISQSQVNTDVASLVNATSGATVSAGGVRGTVVNPSYSITALGPFATSVSDKPLTGRIFFGYQLYPQLAFELGLLTIRDQNSSYTSGSNVVTNSTISSGGVAYASSVTYSQVTHKDVYSNNAIDLNVKGIVPLNDKFYLYAKLGIAYMKATIKTTITMDSPTSASLNGVPYTPQNVALSLASKSSNWKGYPTLGIGAGYNVTDSVDLDLSWYRLISENNTFNSVNIIYGGVLVKFGG